MNLTRNPVCVKLVNGDTLFAESNLLYDKDDMVTFYFPLKAMIVSGTKLAIYEWVPFTEERNIKVHRSDIITTTKLSSEYSRVYASYLFSSYMNETKAKLGRIAPMQNSEMKKMMDILYEDLLTKACYLEVAYNMDVVESSNMRYEFYKHLIDNLPTTSETLQ